MNKRLAITLYLIFGMALTLVLTFGKTVAWDIIDALDLATHSVDIDDVAVELEDGYIIEKTFSPEYTPMGRIGKDAALKFEALDDTLTVNSHTGAFKGKRTDDDTYEGRIRISSEHDPNFEKIITVRFFKKYPESFEARYIVKGFGDSVSYTRVGLPVITYAKFAAGAEYSEKVYDIIYDPEYFAVIDSVTLMPIKETPEGEKLTLTYVFANGVSATTKEFSIRPKQIAESFDEIRLTNKSKASDGAVGSYYHLNLYKDGEMILTNYTVTFANGLASLNSMQRVRYNKIGTEEITVTLPNGFSKTISVEINNIIAAPDIEGAESDGGLLKLKRKNATELKLIFDSSVTYKSVKLEYDKDMLSAKLEGSTLTLTGKKLGESTLTLTVDDGRICDVRSFTVKTELDTNLYSIIKNDTSVFVHKFLGHICGFAILAFFALNMFRYLKKRRPVTRFLHYSACALVFAWVTEFIQYFMKNRTSSVTDIAIDMSGYYLGTIVAFGVAALTALLRKCAALRRKIRKRRNTPPL